MSKLKAEATSMKTNVQPNGHGTTTKPSWDELLPFFELSLDLLCIAGTDGYFKHLNPAFESILGWSAAELLAEPFITFVHPDDIPATQTELAKLTQGKDAIYFEQRFRCQNGDYKWLAWTGRPTADGMLYATARDITGHKQIAEELAQERQLLRTVIDNIPDHIYVKDTQGHFILGNLATARSLGVASSAEIAGKTDFDFSPPEFAAKFQAEEQALFQAGHSPVYREDLIFDQLTGEQRWIKSTKMLTRNDRGEITTLVGINHDVTEIKRAQKAAQQSQQMLQLVLDNVPQRVFWKDKNLVYLGCNRLFAGDAGLDSPEQIIGKVDQDMPWQEQAELYTSDDRAVMESNTSKLNYEEPQTTPTGERIWLQTSKVPLYDAQGNVMGILGMYGDITPRKQAEERLRQSEALLNAIVNNSETSIYVLDTQGRFLLINDRFAQLFGLDKDAVIGKTDLDIFPQETAEVYQSGDLEILKAGVPVQVEEFVSLEDELRHFVTVKFPLRDASGVPYALCGLSTEITQQKRLEQQLHKAAERRNRQIQLSAQIAHDIAATTHLAELYQRVLTRINEQFGFYHTQLFRYQAHLEALIPVAGYGEAGKQIVAEGQRLKLGVGLIGAAAATGSSLLRPDLSTEARWQPHPLLPATKGELAVPITLGGEDSEAQVTALRYFVESEFDGFIVIPLDTAAVAPAAQQALRAGKPVVSISNDLGKQNQTALIMSVEHQLGYLLGQQAGEWTKKHLAAGETLNLGLLTYLKPFGGLPEREQGIIDGLTEAFGNNFNVLWHRVEGTPAPGLLDWLKLHPELKMVLGLTDGLALDAYQAVIAAGKNEAQTFFVGGVDALPEALAAIKAVGAFQATVTQSPREMGIVALRTLVAAIKGLPYEPVTSIQHVPVNLTNVDEFLTDNSIIPLDTNLAGLDLSDLKIGFSTLNLTNPFFISMVESAQAEAVRLGIQLVINNPRRVLGVLDVQTDQPGVLAVEDQLVLEGLAAQIAAAIESTRLRQDAEERLQEVSALQRLMTREGWQAYQAASQQAQTAYLFKQGVAQPIAVAELPQLGNGAAQPEPAKNDGHMVAKPMAVHGEVIGALGIQVEPDNPLTYEDEQFLAAMSEQVAEALERARLLNQTQKRAGEMETVTQVGVVAASTLEVQELLQTIVELTKSRFGLYHAHIYLLDEAGADLVLVAGAGEPGRQMVAQGWRISLNHSSSIVALTARNRHGVIVNDTHQNPNFLPNPLLPATRSELAVPMLAGDKLLGVLDVQAEVANRFTDDDAKIKTILANQVAIALQNARLFDEHQRARHLLNERIKELNCLNDIGREIEETPAIPDFLEWVAQRIPSATQHPELCRVAIEFDGHTYGLAEAIDIPYQMTHGLRVGNEVVGRIYIAYTQKQDFLNEESALLGGVARRVSGYIENRRLFDQTQANLAESSTLYRLGTELNQVRTFEELVDVIASIETDTKIDGITILTLEVDQAGNPEWAEIVASRITLDQPALPNGTRLYLPQFPLSSLWIDDPYTVIAIENIATDERIDPITRTAFGSNDNMADVILPLAVAGRWIGLIALTWPSAQVFTDKDKRIFQSAARQIAVVMNNQLLFAQTQANLAETDALYQLSAQLNAANNFDDIVDVIASIETDTKVEAVTLLTLDIDPSGKPEWGEVVATRTPPGQSALPTGTRFYLPQFPLSFLWIDDPYGIVVLENIAADERVDPVTKALFDNINNGATIILPLAIAGQWVGLFSLGWTSAQVFTEKDKRILQSVARQIAVVMNNQLLFAQTQAALTQTQAVLGETNTLFRVAQALAQIEDERMMFEFVLSEYLRTLNLSQGGVVIIDDSDSGYGTLRALMVGGKLVEPGLRVPMIGNPAAEKVINTRRAVAISDALQDPLMEPVRDFVHQMGYKSILLAPIVVRERVYGILGADSVEIIHEFTDREIAFVQAMADQLGIALENRRLLAEAQAALAQVEATQRRYTVQAWETYLAKNKAVSYEQAREGVAPLGENLLPQINQAIMEGRQPAAQSHSLLVSPVQPDETDSSLIVPLAVRGQTIGVLGLQETNPTETWSPEEVALVEAIARQIAEAAESLRLVDETQQQAARERRVNEIGEKIQRAQSLEEALQIAIKEVGLSLQAPQTSVQLEVQ